MRRAAIVCPVRTPVGKFLGSLSGVPVEGLAGHVLKAVVARSGIDPALIEDVIFAQSYANGETPCTGRWAALAAGLPIEAPGAQVDRRCGGGLQAIVTAAMMVQTGAADVVAAGGVESMSNVEHYALGLRAGVRQGSFQMYDRLDRARERSQPLERFGPISGMIETAENLGREYQIGREACDAFAAESQRKAAMAWAQRRFDEEIEAIEVPQRRGDRIVVDRDEGVRGDTTVDTLGTLGPLIRGGVTTAGNSSQQSDAAACCLLVAEDRLEPLGLQPIGFLAGWAAIGCHPATMGIGPVPAVEKLFTRTGLGWKDIDLVELNEAFAVQALAVLKGWGWNEPDKLNVNGSGISLGHPIAATGVRMTTTLLYEMRRRQSRKGLVAMCIGGGQGMAAVFEAA